MIQAIISILYNAALLLLLLLGLPWWLFLLLWKPRFRQGLSQRFLGVSGEFAKGLPVQPRIWIHAVSVGEVLAISSLVRELTRLVPGYTIAVSTTTRTGQQLARERFGSARCFYFPFDFPWSVATTLRRVSPAMLILAESELWPNVLRLCDQQHIPIVVVNARVSDRSLPRYLKLRPLWQPFLRLLSMVFSQTEQDADRLRKIGVPSDRVRVGGNLKFDVRAPQDVAITGLLKQHLPFHAKLLVCGSTLEGEEAMLLAAWPEILAAVPDALLMLAPRHPERFAAVADLLAASPHLWISRSQWVLQPKAIETGSIFLLDSIGELASLYSLARVAFVGGSLVPAGGHNPLEPAQFGVAITTGPHFENFRAVVELLVESNAMTIVKPSELAPILAALLVSERENADAGRNAKNIYERESGASVRSAQAIVALLRSSGAKGSAGSGIA